MRCLALAGVCYVGCCFMLFVGWLLFGAAYGVLFDRVCWLLLVGVVAVFCCSSAMVCCLLLVVGWCCSLGAGR